MLPWLLLLLGAHSAHGYLHTMAPPLRRHAIGARAAARCAESAASDESLVTLSEISPEYLALCEKSLEDRNKERILSGLPKYESIDAMIDAYMDFEGKDKGLSQAQAENEVLRYLQRRALLSEGGADLSDPQTIVTFGLAALLLGSIVFNQLSGMAS